MSDASRLLGLEGLAVQPAESDVFGGRVVHVVTANETASACPSCGVLSVTLKGLACTRPRDIPYGTTRLLLIWHKRRWRCKEQFCPRASFTESLPAVRARSRLTTWFRTELGSTLAEQQQCVSEAATHFSASWPIVHNAFVEHVRAPLAAPLPPAKVLGSDETHQVDQSSLRTRTPSGGCWCATGGTPGSSTPPPAAFWPRSRAAAALLLSRG